MEKAAQAPLEHLYNDHEFCGAWCRRQQNTSLEQRIKARQYYHSKDKHGKLYIQTKGLFGEFMSRKCLEECHHKYDTQLNEGLNIAVAMVWSEKKFWSAVFKKLDIEVTDGMNFLEKNDNTLVQRQEYKKLTTTKMKRKKGDCKRVKSECEKTKKDVENGLSYGDDNKADLSGNMLSMCI
eukprot:8680892-Ditylum_brightwellii.AAC.1